MSEGVRERERGEGKRERTLRIGEGEEAGGTGKRNCVEERSVEEEQEKERQRRERDDRTRGTDVFETSCRSSHA